LTRSGDPDNLSQLLSRIQSNRDDDACAELWEAVYERVVVLARERISLKNRRVADEEDIALSAINSFVRAAEAGRLNSLHNRDDLWRVLITIMARKANAYNQRQAADKRGQGEVRGDSVFASQRTDEGNGFNSVEDSGDPNRFVDELLGECRERIEALPEEMLRVIALKRMEGYEVTEIAQQLAVSVATIKRKLARIRGLWANDAPQ
jgi:DNA-directed RNA polymerase specialized sigma24 family protein